MSGEQIVGHVSWSPDFKSGPPTDIQKLIDEGKIKFEPRWQGDKLVSFDMVAAQPVQFEPASPDDAEVAAALRPHKEEPEITTLIGSHVSEEVAFTYTNWRGKTGERRAVFTLLQFGSTVHHPEPQLLIHGYDLDKKAPRTYAVKDISNVRLLQHE